jgi:hypothetical protein
MAETERLDRSVVVVCDLVDLVLAQGKQTTTDPEPDVVGPVSRVGRNASLGCRPSIRITGRRADRQKPGSHWQKRLIQ